MTVFDYAYENVKEFAEDATETLIEFVSFIANVLLCIIVYGTFPIWVVPYLIWKRKEDAE